MRISLNSDPVVAGFIGDDLPMDSQPKGIQRMEKPLNIERVGCCQKDLVGMTLRKGR